VTRAQREQSALLRPTAANLQRHHLTVCQRRFYANHVERKQAKRGQRKQRIRAKDCLL
jgi:hypothetical protein